MTLNLKYSDQFTNDTSFGKITLDLGRSRSVDKRHMWFERSGRSSTEEQPMTGSVCFGSSKQGSRKISKNHPTHPTRRENPSGNIR